MHQIIFSLMASFSARCELQFSERNLTKSERKARLDNSFLKMILLNEPKKMLSRRKIYHFRKMVEKRGGGGGDKNLIYPLFFKITIIRKSNPSSLQVNTFLPHPQQHKSDYLLPFQDFTSQQQQQQQPSQPFNPFNFGGTPCLFHPASMTT